MKLQFDVLGSFLTETKAQLFREMEKTFGKEDAFNATATSLWGPIFSYANGSLDVADLPAERARVATNHHANVVFMNLPEH